MISNTKVFKTLNAISIILKGYVSRNQLYCYLLMNNSLIKLLLKVFIRLDHFVHSQFIPKCDYQTLFYSIRLTFMFEVQIYNKTESRFYKVNSIGKFSEISFNDFKHESNERNYLN